MKPHYLLPFVLLACETETATTAVVDNRYPADNVVYRAWWVASYFDMPVYPAASSETIRSVPATGPAYVIVAPKWDPSSSDPPTTFVPMQSKAPLSVSRGDTLHIAVDDAGFYSHLSLHDATYIQESIFPGELGGMDYDVAEGVFKKPSEK